jgi:TonB family protein
MITYTAAEYRQVIFTPGDDLFRRCLIGSAVLGTLVLIAILVTPAQRQVITHVSQLPERIARLIIEKPAPVVETAPETAPTKATEEAEPEAVPEPVTPRVRQRPVDPEAGKAGRERATETISKELASTTAALQSSLDELSTSLQSSQATTQQPVPKRRSRRVRSGRSSGEIASVQTGVAGGSADLSGSAVQGSRLNIGTLSAGSSSLSAAAGATEATSSGSGSPPGVHRSNASLLAVIQKYSAGIHYCYANELKRNENLKGKLVVAMTVAASGEVVNAVVVENTLGAERLEECALSQIRDWKFPPISGGMTTFQAPFVFTPPK